MNLSTRINAELWSAVRRSYEAEAWTNAILDGIYHFSDTVRLKSGLQSDGTALAGQAFGGKDPKIKLNRLATESDKNIQAGVEQLVRGLFQAVRNPRSHERFDDSQKDCESILVFVDYLLGVIGHARSAFSIESTLSRINDENFVANKRYAELVLSEIPRNKRLDTLIAAFEQRDMAACLRLKQFFQACIADLDAAEKEQFFEVVSQHLRLSNVDDELRTVLQLLETDQWLLVAEADRMRSENRIIRSMAAGRYVLRTNKCLAGGLATWATPFLGKFTLKREALAEIHRGLTSNSREQQDYMLKYFFQSLNELADTPPANFLRLINERLRAGDSRFKVALSIFDAFDTEAWTKPFEKELQRFKANDNAVIADDFEDDDIPF